MMIDLPKYINDVLHIGIQQTGLYTSAPWAIRILITFAGGRVADWLIRTNRMSVTNTRKLFIVIGETYNS